MAEMVLTTGTRIDSNAVRTVIKKLTNHMYKLLPMREQGSDWKKLLETLIVQVSGMKELLQDQDELIFSLLCKMKGLFNLTDDKKDLVLYRRIIFECLGILNNLEKNVCG